MSHDKDTIETIESDVLIIGSGIAGLRAALEVSSRRKHALVVSKSPLGKANNTYLAGGVFRHATDQYGVDEHFTDTIEHGRTLNDRSLVERFTREAPSAIEELKEMGLQGTPERTGFSCRLTTLAGGQEVTRSIMRACRKEGVHFLEGLAVTDLVVKDSTCHGAIGFDKRTGKVYGLSSKATILALGGAGACYVQNDNAPGLTGDGYVLGMEAGLELIDMEFIQFYPLVYAGSRRARTIIPAWFADYGIITNRMGENVKEKYKLHEKSLAIVARDRLSQALFTEMLQGNGIDGALLFDLRGVGDREIPLNNFLVEHLKKKMSFDTKPVPIVPACHHTMGGIPIDELAHTAIAGLYAAGEVTGGVHGANRMGGNALGESLVFGATAGRSSIEYIRSQLLLPRFDSVVKAMATKRLSPMRSGNAKTPISGCLMGRLKRVLWEKVGIIRSEQSLRKGIEEIDEILMELENDRPHNPVDLLRYGECRNAALTGRAIAVSSLARTESRGSHYRKDFPREDPHWRAHIHMSMAKGFPDISRIVPIV